MKLGSLFGQTKTLAKAPSTTPKKGAGASNIEKTIKRKTPGDFGIKWPSLRQQGVKDYKPILTLPDLEAYLLRCQDTGLGGFDWETAADQTTRSDYLEKEQQVERALHFEKIEPKEAEKELKTLRETYLKTPLDPHKGEICTVSLAAAPDEARVVPISNKKGQVFEPDLSREEARKLVLDTLERLFFTNKKVMKIAENLAFETKYAAKYKKYILMPVADPQIMRVRVLQVVAPQKIEDEKWPVSGWGLKNATKKIFGVIMGSNFVELLKRHGAEFFDEIPADKGEGLIYSAEDADYAVQHYLYWIEVAKQIPNYYKWLHEIEMPFSRVIGLMEFHGMRWDSSQAEVKREEAVIMQEKAAEDIRQIAKDLFDLDINTGKSGKTNEVKSVIFDHMKLPAAKWGKTGPSLDEEALIDMQFMLENNLVDLSEEKYLALELPGNWETIDVEKDPSLDKQQRGAIRVVQRGPHPYKEKGIELIQLLKNIQKYSTLLSSHIVGREKYVNERTNRIHANYTPWTRTSRLNSSKPNGQNVPNIHNDVFGIRNFYTAAPGKVLFLIDFAGFELRILAWKSGDETMIDIFKNNGDIHRKTGAEITGKPEEEVTKLERRDAKPANFGIAYGGTEHALQKTIKTDYGQRKTLDECLYMVNAVKKAYPRIPEFQREIVLEAREKGYVSTIYGYIRLLTNINSANRYTRGEDERRAANTPIQGTAADVMKEVQNKTYDKIGEDTAGLSSNPIMKHGSVDMIAQIHDEVIFEMDDDPAVVKAAGDWVKATMEKPPIENFPVPVLAEASVAYSWGKKVDVEEWLEPKGAHSWGKKMGVDETLEPKGAQV